MNSVPSVVEKPGIKIIPDKEVVQYHSNGINKEFETRSQILNISDLCLDEGNDTSSIHTNYTDISMESKKSNEESVIRLKDHLDSFPNMKDVECIYIEIGSTLDTIEEDDGINSSEDTKIDRRRSNFVYQSNPIPISLHVKSAIKNTFNIDDNQGIRVTARTTKKNRIERRRRPHPRLEDLATKCNPVVFPKSSMMKSEMYNWMIIMIGIFYVVPVIQLMNGAQRISHETGSEDVCYYNFLCRYKSQMFHDYGHVFSNITYISFGILFIILVFIRREKRRRAMVELFFEKQNIIHDGQKETIWQKYEGKSSEYLNQVGIPEQYGIFFALGSALVFEGILSACYHVCPMSESFQFDTTFMYMIMALIYLKMYQFRHPDLTSNAYVPFTYITVMIIFEATGYYWSYYLPFGVFLSIFITVFMVVIYLFGLDMYFKGDLLATLKELCRMKDPYPRMKIGFFDKENVATKRDIFYVLMIILNLILAIFFIVHYYVMEDDRARVSYYLMGIFAFNMTGYAMRYIITKLYYANYKKMPSETLSRTCMVYILLWISSAAFGLYFFAFLPVQKSTRDSPSLSRHLNQECYFLFFDAHDIWHFASSASLFFCFMILLTLEDNNTSTPWQDIPVF